MSASSSIALQHTVPHNLAHALVIRASRSIALEDAETLRCCLVQPTLFGIIGAFLETNLLSRGHTPFVTYPQHSR